MDGKDDIQNAGGPLGAVKLLELLEQNLHSLAVWCVRRDEMDALG